MCRIRGDAAGKRQASLLNLVAQIGTNVRRLELING
jgi:hypothetical protein